ncbi:hypothetical protein BBP40_012577 [Aspergillus hancockii]|nr:hypothetical protein BBP40_012577 [Aspergillus hancockii]
MDSTWPLGLDLLVKAFLYERRQQTLKFYLDVVAESATTFEQNLLFARGIDTIEPRNIQAILSSEFTATPDFLTLVRKWHLYSLCVGREFALLEAGYTIVRLLQTIEYIDQVARFAMAVGEERQKAGLQVRTKFAFPSEGFCEIERSFSHLSKGRVTVDFEQFPKDFLNTLLVWMQSFKRLRKLALMQQLALDVFRGVQAESSQVFIVNKADKRAHIVYCTLIDSVIRQFYEGVKHALTNLYTGTPDTPG